MLYFIILNKYLLYIFFILLSLLFFIESLPPYSLLSSISFIFLSISIKDILTKYFIEFKTLIYMCQELKSNLILSSNKSRMQVQQVLFLQNCRAINLNDILHLLIPSLFLLNAHHNQFIISKFWVVYN